MPGDCAFAPGNAPVPQQGPALPRPDQPSLRLPPAAGAVPPPSGAFPAPAAFGGIYWRAPITPVKIIGYAKLRRDIGFLLRPARCESQSAPPAPRALALGCRGAIASGSGRREGAELAPGSVQRGTKPSWPQRDPARRQRSAPTHAGPGSAGLGTGRPGGAGEVWGLLASWRPSPAAAGRGLVGTGRGFPRNSLVWGLVSGFSSQARRRGPRSKQGVL